MEIIDIEDSQINLVRITPGRQDEAQEKAQKCEAEFFHVDILEERADGASKTSGASFWKYLMFNGQDLTRHPLHQGIISTDQKYYGICPTKSAFRFTDHICNYMYLYSNCCFCKIFALLKYTLSSKINAPGVGTRIPYHAQ